MSQITSIALSGLNAAQRRLQVVAENVANVDSDGALPNASTGAAGTPAPFQPLQVSQQPLLDGGTSATVTALKPAVTTQFAPDQPFADKNGLVAAPNVDLVSQGLDQIAAVNAYKANLRVLQVADALDKKTIDSIGGPSTNLSA